MYRTTEGHVPIEERTELHVEKETDAYPFPSFHTSILFFTLPEKKKSTHDLCSRFQSIETAKTSNKSIEKAY